MAQQRHLANAPIREALIDLRVKTSSTIEDVRKCVTDQNDRYPKRTSIVRGGFGLSLEAGQSKIAHHNLEEMGYRMDSSNGKDIVQFRLDGFTFSRLSPYVTWEEMRDEAKAQWNRYASCLGIEAVTRIAVRYINVMELPLAGAKLSEFLTAPPILPTSLSLSMSSFIQRIVVQDPDTSAAVIVTQAVEAIASNGKSPITLDLDVFRDTDMDPRDGEIWEYLESLRKLKNTVFFGCITEPTAELFS